MADKIATALVEQAKATGLKIADVAKKWYAENIDGLTAEQKTHIKEVVSKAKKVANERLKAEQPEGKAHTIRENDDGTFTLVSPLGNEVGVFETLDRAKEAQKLIEQPKEKPKKPKKPRKKPTPTPKGEFSEEVYRI